MTCFVCRAQKIYSTLVSSGQRKPKLFIQRSLLVGLALLLRRCCDRIVRSGQPTYDTLKPIGNWVFKNNKSHGICAFGPCNQNGNDIQIKFGFGSFNLILSLSPHLTFVQLCAPFLPSKFTKKAKTASKLEAVTMHLVVVVVLYYPRIHFTALSP